MLHNLDELRRQARASDSERDWQQLSRASMRAGVDCFGHSLPEGAFLRLAARGMVHWGGLKQLRLSPCGQYLISSGQSKAILWHRATKQILWQWSCKEAVRFLFDEQGAIHCYAQGRSPWRGLQRLDRDEAGQGSPRYRRIHSSHQRLEYVFVDGARGWLAMSPTSGQLTLIHGPDERRIEVSSELKRLRLDSHSLSVKPGHNMAYAVASSGVGHANRARSVLWAQSLTGLGQRLSPPQESAIDAYVVTEERAVLALRGGQLRVWDFGSSVTQHVATLDRHFQIQELNLVSDGETLIVLQGPYLVALDTQTWQPLWRRTLSLSSCLACHEPSNTVVLGKSYGNALECVDLNTGQPFLSRPWPAQSVAELKLFEEELLIVDKDRQARLFHLHTHALRGLNRGEYISSGGDGQRALVRRSKGVAFIDMNTDSVLWTHADQRYGTVVGESVLNLHYDFQRLTEAGLETLALGPVGEHPQVCFAPSGRWLALYSLFSDADFGTLVESFEMEAEFSLRRVETGEELWNIELGSPQSLAFSRDESVLWVTYPMNYLATVQEIEAYDRETGARVVAIEIPSHGEVFAAQPGSHMIATAAQNRVVLWCRHRSDFIILKGHERFVVALCFSKDGRSLVSADDQGHLLFWDLSPYLPDASKDSHAS